MKVDTLKTKSLYFSKLDGLRFLAFLLVFIGHFPPLNIFPLQTLHSYGWSGVELFFVLSSFLLTRLLVLEYENYKKVAIKKFYLRRILRIWPLYFFYIILICLIFELPKVFDNQTILRSLGLLTFSDNIFAAFWSFNPIIPYVAHLWTISLEMQYYILLPFIIPLFFKLKRKTVVYIFLTVWLIMITCRIAAVILKTDHPFIWVLPIQCDAFLGGTLLGLGILDRLFSKLKSNIEIILGILLLVVTYMLPNITELGYSQVVSYTFLALGFIFILDGILRNTQKWSELLLANPVAKYLGKISFGLYIYHLVCILFILPLVGNISLLANLSPNLYWIITFSLILLLVIILSTLSYELFEKRFLKLKSKVTVIESRPI